MFRFAGLVFFKEADLEKNAPLMQWRQTRGGKIVPFAGDTGDNWKSSGNILTNGRGKFPQKRC
jgi:hypothetical protein